MSILIKIGIFFLNIIYFFIKLLPTKKNKITFISRQTDGEVLDFKLLKDEIKRQNENIEMVFLCKRLKDGFKNKISYSFHMLIQMYHIATSKMVILDSYCITISILKQKKSLKVIQMWHALGSLKKFGYSTLDLKDGRSSKTAKLMKMHNNYDYVISSSEESKKYFAEAFGVSLDKALVYSLPRVDYLKSKKMKNELTKSFYEKYPNIPKNKKIILYCPTSRKDGLSVTDIAKHFDLKKYVLIIKYHSSKNIIFYDENNTYKENYFTGMQLLHVASYVISDYSAIIYEAIVASKPVFLYLFDLNSYEKDRGFYINLEKELDAYKSNDIDKIAKAIEKNNYNLEKQKLFLDKYVDNTSSNCTSKLSAKILDLLK